MSDDVGVSWEVWRRDYGTFDQGSFELAFQVNDKALAEYFVDQSKGWGVEWQVREVRPVIQPGWTALSLEEFQRQYVVDHGSVYEIDSEWGQEILASREREAAAIAEDQRLYDDAHKMKQIPKRERGTK